MTKKTEQLNEADANSNLATIAPKGAPDSISNIVPTPEEVVATVVAAARAVGAQAPKRLADKDSSDEQKTIKESLTVTFGNILTESGLDETLVTKATTIFEAAVAEKVSNVEKELVEDFAAYKEEIKKQFDEEVKKNLETLSEKLVSYADYVAKEFVTENKLAIENGLRVDLAESLFAGMRKVFVEHNITLPEQGIDVVKSLEEKVNEVTEKLNAQINENLELKKKNELFEAAKVVDGIVSGLPASQAEKIRSLSESVSYSNLEELKTKVEVIRESVVAPANAAKRPSDNFLTEQIDIEETKVVSPTMKAYLDALTRTASK